MTVNINADTTSGLQLESDTSGEIDLQTNGTTKVHMDSSGNVGIGTSSPTEGQLVVRNDSGDAKLNIKVNSFDGTNGVAALDFSTGGQGANDPQARIHALGANNYSAGIVFSTQQSGTTNPLAERMRINSVGQLQIGTTGELNNSFVCIEADGTNPNGVEIRTDANNNAITFYSGSTTYAGAITLSGASTSYTSASDYRLKENIDYTWDATTRLKQLKPCRFNWIDDDTDTALDGFLAHEVSTVVPDAVKGTKDATKTQNVYDDNGIKTGTETVPDYIGIDQSKLVPLLVKTIQELEERITALENN